jgi:hypothetical protein
MSLDELLVALLTYDRIFILGKGPSMKLAKIDPAYPVIAINHAGNYLDQLELNPDRSYTMMQDKNIKIECKRSRKVVSATIAHEHPEAIVFHRGTLHLQSGGGTVACALKIASLAGIKNVTLAGFDAFTDGDVTYADPSIPKNPLLKTQKPVITMILKSFDVVLFQTLHGCISLSPK